MDPSKGFWVRTTFIWSRVDDPNFRVHVVPRVEPRCAQNASGVLPRNIDPNE